ncbi:MAG: hypothetical protein EZS28_018433 [Streblomastix strix]|uniref:Reverse transcriptase domain-containing protein n=1 Tax=Streblomastix strix TaxID=222440 RepID=A0A5J4VTT4_9EUKA|nr:MAG: hypothetical protein EZS28_018433 [Streblomastix strix]
MKPLQEEINQKVIIQVNPHHIQLYPPTFCNPKRDGSYRKILDARNLNTETKRIHFKIISPQDVQFAIQQNDFLTSLVIKSAFIRITVHPTLQPYLGFQVANASYVYIGMPFGLQLAPVVFSKILQAALAAAKDSLSSTILQYADDILLINKNKQMDLGHEVNDREDATQPLAEVVLQAKLNDIANDQSILNRIKDRAARLRGWDSTLQLKLTILPELYWWQSMILSNKPLELLMKSMVTATMTTDASKTA